MVQTIVLKQAVSLFCPQAKTVLKKEEIEELLKTGNGGDEAVEKTG